MNLLTQKEIDRLDFLFGGGNDETSPYDAHLAELGLVALDMEDCDGDFYDVTYITAKGREAYLHAI